MTNLSDEILVARANDGDGKSLDALLYRYTTTVKQLARKFYLVGGETEDLIQEGMMALFKAVSTFDDSKNASFKTYATNCVRCNILDTIKRDSTQKNRPLNDGAPIETAIDFSAPEDDPLVALLGKEAVDIINGKIAAVLSDDERKLFNDYLEGLSYAEIGERHGLSVKKIDNSLQKIKRNLKKTLS